MTEKTVIEMIAPTVEEAVDLGLEQLGLSREAVEVEVLDAGSKGLFGIGNRQARVRLTVITEVAEDDETETLPEDLYDESDMLELEVEKRETRETIERPFDAETALDVTRHVVAELLEKMRVRAEVKTELLETEEAQGKPVIHVDIQGNDLSILIGRQAETLNALQYISSLIVAKELGHWVTLMVDVQGYRTRREQQLRKLARRLADQAIHTGRRQVLEPMPANERRFIHLELRNHPDVVTESIGDEPNRKVTISLKK